MQNQIPTPSALGASVAALALASLVSGPVSGWDITWIHQFGTPGFEFSTAGAADASGMYVAGDTSSAFPGHVNAGLFDGFVRKYDPTGSVLWTAQFGTSASDLALDVGADSTGVYVAGQTSGALGTALGGIDVYVRKLSPAGAELWTTQLGTELNDVPLFGTSLSVHPRGIYLTGATRGEFPGEVASGPIGSLDLFVARLDPATGHLLWARQFGSPRDDLPPVRFGGVSAHDSGVYVVANLDPYVDFTPVLRKYDETGNLLWSLPVGRGDCEPALTGVATHDSGVYVTGQSYADPYENDANCVDEAGWSNVVGVLNKYDFEGNPVWTRTIEGGSREGGDHFTGAKGVAAFDSGVYVGGNLTTSFAGHTKEKTTGTNGLCGGNQGPFFSKLDAYVRRFDFDGDVVWTHQFGGPGFEIVFEVASFGTSLYAGAETHCVIAEGQTSQGNTDAFAVRIEVDPTTPAGLLHLLVGRLETLRAAGDLATGPFDALVGHLESALAALSRDEDEPTARALSAFIHYTDALETAGALSATDAEVLTFGASQVLAEL